MRLTTIKSVIIPKICMKGGGGGVIFLYEFPDPRKMMQDMIFLDPDLYDLYDPYDLYNLLECVNPLPRA